MGAKEGMRLSPAGRSTSNFNRFKEDSKSCSPTPNSDIVLVISNKTDRREAADASRPAIPLGTHGLVARNAIGGKPLADESDGDAAADGEDRVVKVFVRTKDASELNCYPLKDTEPLKTVLDGYLRSCRQEMQPVDHARFEFRSQEVNGAETPRELGMQDYDVIEARFEGGEVVESGVKEPSCDAAGEGEEAKEDGGGGGEGGDMAAGAEDAGGAEGDGVETDRQGGGEGQGAGRAGDAGGSADVGGRGVGSEGSGQGGDGDVRGHEKDGGAGQETRLGEDRVVTICVGTKDGRGPERNYELKDTEPLKTVLDGYLRSCRQEMQLVDHARFEFRSQEVNGAETPRELGMQDYDVIEARFEGGEVVESGVAKENGVIERDRPYVAQCFAKFQNVTMPNSFMEKLCGGESKLGPRRAFLLTSNNKISICICYIT